MKANIMRMERGIRMTAGGALVLGVLTNPFSPAWLALIGAYLVLTGIARFEPIYTLATATRSRSTATNTAMTPREFALEP